MSEELHELLEEIIEYFEDRGSLSEGVYGVIENETEAKDTGLEVGTVYHAWYGARTPLFSLKEIDRRLKALDEIYHQSPVLIGSPYKDKNFETFLADILQRIKGI